MLNETLRYKDSENCNNKKGEDMLTINFTECTRCREHIYVGFGSTTYERVSPENGH